MDPQILAFIKRKRFAVLSQWKREIENRYPFYIGQAPKLRPALLFRTFDSVLRQLKHPDSGFALSSMPLLDQISSSGVPPLRWYAEVFLIGEEVMGDFFITNLAPERRECGERMARFQNALYAAFHRIIQKELHAWRSAVENPTASVQASALAGASTAQSRNRT